jgi:REP element-mobilizing transposase RayT
MRARSSRRSRPRAQLELPLPRGSAKAHGGGWGGKRRGAGRKPALGKAGVAHRARPEHRARHPVHVTLRAGVNVLRRQSVFAQIRCALAAASRRLFRIVHFSVQSNHIHLIVEARDKAALSSGARGLAIRLARGVNRAAATTGRVWTDRYHARALQTPREVRNALVYVLLNRKKHGSFPGVFGDGVDRCSSAVFFDGWAKGWRPASDAANAADTADAVRAGPRGSQGQAEIRAASCPVVPARTWLARVGWRRHGRLRFDEAPKSC